MAARTPQKSRKGGAKFSMQSPTVKSPIQSTPVKSPIQSPTAKSPPPSGNIFYQCLNDNFRTVIDSLDNLRNDLENLDLSLTLPRVVVVGPENCGKSSVLERLVSNALFPRDKGTCTRMPIELRCVHQSEVEFKQFSSAHGFQYDPSKVYCRLAREDDGVETELMQWQLVKDLPQSIRSQHDAIVKEKSEQLGKPVGIVSDVVLVIQLRGEKVQNLTLLDLPGYIAVVRKDEPPETVQQIKALIESYLRDPNTMVLAIMSAAEGFRNSQALEFVQSFKKMDQTVGVLTKSDRTEDTRPEFRDKYHELKAILDDHDDIHFPSGKVALRNRDTSSSTEKDTSMVAVSKKEMIFFDEYFAEYADQDKVGLSALSKKLVEMMLRFTQDNWIETTRSQIARYKEDKSNNMNSDLGELPKMDDEVLFPFLSMLIDVLIADWHARSFFVPQCWAQQFPSTPSWEQFLQRFQQSDLSALAQWRDFKAALLHQDLLSQVMEEFLLTVVEAGLGAFSQVAVDPNNHKLYRFDTLQQAIQGHFFNFEKETKERALKLLQEQSATLCLLYESLPQSRFELFARLTHGIQSILFEQVLLANFERFSIHLDASTILHQLIESQNLKLEDLLAENSEWSEKRKAHHKIIRNLENAETAISDLEIKIKEMTQK